MTTASAAGGVLARQQQRRKCGSFLGRIRAALRPATVLIVFAPARIVPDRA
jgi:hypothetical protein